MPQLLHQKYGRIPIEREYEGWIVWLMHEYFESVGVPADIRALGSQEEFIEPADEWLAQDGKIIGFQFKRPHTNSNGFGRVCWRLRNSTSTQNPDPFRQFKLSSSKNARFL